MKTELITLKDVPTHRLTIKLDDGRYRVFYLSTAQADATAKGLNGPDRFIILPKSVDPRSPSAYPKTWATLEGLTDEEKESRRNRYAQSIESAEEKAADERKKKDQATVRAWVEAHPEEFAAMKEKAAAEYGSTPGMYHTASKPTKAYLVHFKAVGYVYDLLFPS